MVFVVVLLLSLFTSFPLYCQKQEGTRSLNMVLLIDRGEEPRLGPLVNHATQAILQKAGILVITGHVFYLYLQEAFEFKKLFENEAALLKEKQKWDTLYLDIKNAEDELSKVDQVPLDFLPWYKAIRDVLKGWPRSGAESPEGNFLERVERIIHSYGGVDQIANEEKSGKKGAEKVHAIKVEITKLLGDMFVEEFKLILHMKDEIDNKLWWVQGTGPGYEQIVADAQRDIEMIKGKFGRVEKLKRDFSVQHGATGVATDVYVYTGDLEKIQGIKAIAKFIKILQVKFDELVKFAAFEEFLKESQDEKAVQQKFSIQQKVHEIVKVLTAAQRVFMRDLMQEQQAEIEERSNMLRRDLKIKGWDLFRAELSVINKTADTLKGFGIYYQDAGDYYILIPNEYKDRISVKGLSIDRALGLNISDPSNVKKMVYKNIDQMLKEVIKNKSRMVDRVYDEAQSLSKLFVLGKEPELGSWNMFISGHGLYETADEGQAEFSKQEIEKMRTMIKSKMPELGSRKRINGTIDSYGRVFEQAFAAYLFSQDKNIYEWAQEDLGLFLDLILEAKNKQLEQLSKDYGFDVRVLRDRSLLSFYMAKKIERIEALPPLKTDPKIAGMYADDFKALLTVFYQKIKTQFIYYQTCFGGGENLQKIKEHIDALERTVRRIFTSEMGTGPIIVSGAIGDIAQYHESAIEKPLYTDFAGFFGALHKFFHEAAPFERDPIKDILSFVTRSALSPWNITSVPQVRIPGAGIFRAVDVDNRVAILTNAIVHARHIEKKPIVVSNKSAVLVYAERISVPMIFSGNMLPKIISMLPGQAMHTLERVEVTGLKGKDSDDNLEEFLHESIFIRYGAQKTWFIKELRLNDAVFNTFAVRNMPILYLLINKYQYRNVDLEFKTPLYSLGSWCYMYPHNAAGDFVVGTYDNKLWARVLVTEKDIEELPDLEEIYDMKKQMQTRL